MIIALILCIVGLLFFAGMFLYACYHIYMLRHKINIAESHVLLLEQERDMYMKEIEMLTRQNQNLRFHSSWANSSIHQNNHFNKNNTFDNSNSEDIRKCIRIALKYAHPDNGGKPDDFSFVSDVYRKYGMNR